MESEKKETTGSNENRQIQYFPGERKKLYAKWSKKMIKSKNKQVWNWSRKKSRDQEHEMKRDQYMIFHGNEEYFVRNGAWILEESIFLFRARTNSIRYFSVDELNNMNVERCWTFRDGDYVWYRGSWEGRLVYLKLPFRVMIDPACCKEIQSRLLREIVVATQMATHNNVQKPLGCCLETKFPVIVYEWVTPESLGNRILLKNSVLEWKDRLRIAWEISHAVSYLHIAFPRPIIHRDLKPTCVFLDSDQTAKLSNFSLSVSIPEGEEFVKADEIVGTMSYMAPEYAMHGLVTESLDVYSFGVLFLNLLTEKTPYVSTLPGQKSSEWTELITWVRNCLKDNCWSMIVDPTITKNGVTAIEDLQLRASINLALLCITEEADSRPIMADVATALKNMIRSPESIPTTITFQGELVYRISRGNKEHYIQNETLILEEINSLFHGKANPIHYFSIDDLNNMNVEYSLISWDWDRDCAWYRGSWKGRAVMIKLQKRMSEGLSSTNKNKNQLRLIHEVSNKIRLRLLREIVVATQMATCKNVQKLLGCCLETKYPVLVYEQVSAETLKDCIDKDQKKMTLLEWKDRLRIARQISQVVSYLHTAFLMPVIHRCLEPDNVFVDQDNTVKLSNFTPVFIPEDEKFVVEDFIIGDRVYMAPEYHEHREVGECTDVFSFGMLLLVLLTGKLAILPCSGTEEGSAKRTKLTDWVTKEFRKGRITDIVDPAITKSCVAISKLSACLKLALRYTESKKDSRPTMMDVTTELNNMVNSFESMPNTSSYV